MTVKATTLKRIYKAVNLCRAYMEVIKGEEFYATEPDSTWHTTYVFEEVKVNASGTSIIIRYKEWSGREWKQKREQYNFTDEDTYGGYGDAMYNLKWIVRCIKKGYRSHYKEVPSIKA